MARRKGIALSISTGNPELDKNLGGGIPTGSLMLVEGQSDSGKSVLMQQFTWGSLKDSFKVSVLSTEDTVKSFVRQMGSLDKEIIDYLLLSRLKIYPVKATQAKSGPKQALNTLLEALKDQQGMDLVVVDSITSFIAYSSPEDVISFFEECKGLCDDGMTVALVAHSYAFNTEILVRISSMCDAHLRLSLDNIGEKLIKVMEVAKIRGAQTSTGNITSFDILPGLGMKIIPFSKARA
ncbi:MAG: AAA family ATPase [Chloroflexi bacterium]|nr:AAA family ATPase [Chloroflexota bacterium]